MPNTSTGAGLRWATALDALSLALAILAVAVALSGGVRWHVAGVVLSVTSPGRLAAIAALIAIARRVVWRVPGIRHTSSWAPGEGPWRRRIRANGWPMAAVGACILFHLVNNTVWLLNDASSPSFDKALHARIGLDFLRAFQDPTHLVLQRILDTTQYYPPFFHLCTVPFTMAFGFSVQAMAAANCLFLVVLACAIYGIGRHLFDASVGAGAVALTLLFPMVYALSREVLIDFALVAVVAASLYAVLATDAGLAHRRAAGLGLVLGCALLTKWTVLVFVAGPALLWLVVCLRRERPSCGTAVSQLVVVALVAGLLAIPWYVEAMGPFLKGAAQAFGSYPEQEGDPTAVFASLRWYWQAARDVLIMKPLLLVTALALTAFVVRIRSWLAWSFLLAWIAPAAVFFVLIPNKDPRYVAPLLPAVAIMSAAGIRAVPWRAARALAWALILSVGVWQFYAISFAWPARVAHAYAHPPVRADWKVRDIDTALAAMASGQPIKVAVLPDLGDFEANLFQLDAAVRSLPLQVAGFDGRGQDASALASFNVFVSKSGNIAVEWTAAPRLKFRAAVEEWIENGGRNPQLILWRTWPLPDGSSAEVYLIR